MAQKISKKFIDLLTADQLNKVMQVAQKLGINANWLLAVMYYETGYTFSPTATNHIGSVGLIQFTRDKAGVQYKTIGNKVYQLADIKKMSFTEQMDLVYIYFKPYAGKIKSFMDTYLTVFFPASVGKSESYVLQTSNLSASKIASQNKQYDLNSDQQITKGEINSYFRTVFPTIFNTEIDVPYDGVGGVFATYVKQYIPYIAILTIFLFSFYFQPKTY